MSVPVLVYHRVSNEITRGIRPLCISTRVFENQMRLLRRHGYRTVSLSEVAAALRERRALPEKSMALTFDDGYLDVYHNAFPVLMRYGFGATVFLVSGQIGGTNLWDQRDFSLRPLPLMSASAIHEMAAAGIEFGSHSRTHAKLPQLSDEDLESEISGSKEDLQSLLQTEVSSFCYPYFQADGRVLKAVSDAGYAAACGDDRLPPSPLYINRSYLRQDNWPMMYLKLSGLYYRLRMHVVFRAAKNQIRARTKVLVAPSSPQDSDS